MIMLSKENWDRFCHDLTTIDEENQRKINKFMAEIDANILDMSDDGEKICAVVKNLNIENILSTLAEK